MLVIVLFQLFSPRSIETLFYALDIVYHIRCGRDHLFSPIDILLIFLRSSLFHSLHFDSSPYPVDSSRAIRKSNDAKKINKQSFIDDMAVCFGIIAPSANGGKCLAIVINQIVSTVSSARRVG